MDSASLGWGLEGSPRLLETGTESAGMGGLFSVGASHGCSAYSSGREFGVLNSVVQDNGIALEPQLLSVCSGAHKL